MHLNYIYVISYLALNHEDMTIATISFLVFSNVSKHSWVFNVRAAVRNISYQMSTHNNLTIEISCDNQLTNTHLSVCIYKFNSFP